MQPAWGDVPGWFEAVGTVGAFTFAFATYYRDRIRQRRGDERAQAVMVSAWLENSELWYQTGPQPVFEVILKYRYHSTTTPGIGFSMMIDTLPPAVTPRPWPLKPLHSKPLIVLNLYFRDSNNRSWRWNGFDGLQQTKTSSTNASLMEANDPHFRSGPPDTPGGP